MERRKRYHTKKFIFAMLVLFSGFIPVYGRTLWSSIGCSLVYYMEELSNGSLLYCFSNTADASNAYLSGVPEDLLDTFYQNGGFVSVVTKEEADAYVGKTADGYYRNSTHGIYVVDSISARVNPTVVHEFGHYLNDTYVQGADSEEFISVAEEEIERYAATTIFTRLSVFTLDAYKETGSYSEYFADCYSDYVCYPSYLKLAAPKTYAFFDKYYGHLPQ